MFDELEEYKNNDHFFLSPDDNLEKVCNAPKNAIGVYLVYALKKGHVILVYIGSSGKIKRDGRIKPGNGGLYDSLVNENQFNEPKKLSWKIKMKKEKIDALDIYWYATYNEEIHDLPLYAKAIVMQKYFDLNGELPEWNTEF